MRIPQRQVLRYPKGSVLIRLSRIPILLPLCAAALLAEPASAPEAIVENYAIAARERQHALDGASMEIEIHATLPKLKKTGKLQALRRISQLGRITYEALRFEGDGAVKNNVIARYLSAESENQGARADELAITPANYKFKYRGMTTTVAGRPTHVFSVTPKQKKVGMYKGDIWIDAETYLHVRESGSLVKSPSFFLRKVDFVREYEIRDGVAVPRRVKTIVETRLVGKAELTIDYKNVALPTGGAPSTLLADSQ